MLLWPYLGPFYHIGIYFGPDGPQSSLYDRKGINKPCSNIPWALMLHFSMVSFRGLYIWLKVPGCSLIIVMQSPSTVLSVVYVSLHEVVVLLTTYSVGRCS